MVAGPFVKHNHLGGWDPWQLTRSVLAAWWVADDLADGSVASWSDRITGLAVTQGTSGSRPLKAANSFNGVYPGVTFDGIDDNLATTVLTTIPTGSNPGESWGVGNSVTGATFLQMSNYGGSSGGTFRRVTISTSGFLTISDGITDSLSLSPFTIPSIVKGDWSGILMNGYLNGVPNIGNPMTILSLSTGATRLRIGANITPTPAQFWHGPIRHILITKSVLSTLLRQKLEGYFAWDSGLQASLPASHPYQRFHP